MKPVDSVPGLILIAMLAGAGVASAVTGTPPTAGPAAAPKSPAPAATPAAPTAAHAKVTPAELARLAAGKDVVVLDVRAPQEYAEGHVPGAINVPHDQVESRLAELESLRGKPVVVYCKSGRRAGLALDVLSRHGFEDLRHLEGDMPGWAAAGQPVATGPAPKPAG